MNHECITNWAIHWWLIAKEMELPCNYNSSNGVASPLHQAIKKKHLGLAKVNHSENKQCIFFNDILKEWLTWFIYHFSYLSAFERWLSGTCRPTLSFLASDISLWDTVTLAVHDGKTASRHPHVYWGTLSTYHRVQYGTPAKDIQ